VGLNLTVVSGIQQSTSVCNCNIDVYPSPLPLRFPAGDSALRGDFCPSMSVCRILRRQPLNIKHFSLLVSPLYITMYDCLTSSLSCWSLSLPLRCVAPDCFPLFVPGRVPSALPVASIHVQTCTRSIGGVSQVRCPHGITPCPLPTRNPIPVHPYDPRSSDQYSDPSYPQYACVTFRVFSSVQKLRHRLYNSRNEITLSQVPYRWV